MTPPLVDRADTLDLLTRDSADLQRALQHAGLKTSDNGLSSRFATRASARAEQRADPGAKIVADDDPAAARSPRRLRPLRGLGSGIDIKV